MQSVLNVGGYNKTYAIPSYFDGWRHDLLDIDPQCNPDILADARELEKFPPATYDAVYCSHNLEHFYPHDAVKVVRGFHHILKPEGFVEIHVPDILAVMRQVIQNNMDVDDVLYTSDKRPILVRDVLYGYHVEIERSGNDFFAHKTGFSKKSFVALMNGNGFTAAVSKPDKMFEITALFFKQYPSDTLCRFLNITKS